MCLNRINLIPAISLFFAMFAIATAYLPGINGDFIFDDEPSITANPAIHIEHLSMDSLRKAVFSSDSGPLGRPISMLTFALNHYTTGLDPFYFRLMNIGIHLINALLFYVVIRLLLNALPVVFRRDAFIFTRTQKHWSSLIMATTWAIHPLAITSVVYVVQRMTSLSALFVLIGIAIYLRRRVGRWEGKHGIGLLAVATIAMTALSMLCKETGALLIVYLFAIEATIFRFKTANGHLDRAMVWFFVSLLAIPLVLVSAYTALYPQWLLDAYENRAFTLGERLLTQSRVLWFYIGLIVVPNINEMGLFHDHIRISTGLLTPITTLFSIVGIVGLVIVAIKSRHRLPLLSLGIGWFLLGHTLESTALPLEIAHEHRNYLPLFGVILIGLQVYILLVPRRRLFTFAVIALLPVLWVSTAVRASEFGDSAVLPFYEVKHHPNSARSNYEAGRVIAILISSGRIDKNEYSKARAYFERAAEIDPTSTDGLFALVYLSSQVKEPVDPKWLASIQARLGSGPYPASATSLLATFLKQVTSGAIAIDHRVVLDIYQTALSNHRLRGTARAMVMTMLSSYYMSLGNEMMALEHAYGATQAAPRAPVFNVLFADLLLRLDNSEAAREQALMALEKDYLGQVGDHARSILVKVEK